MRVAVFAFAIQAVWAQGGFEGVRSGVLFDRPSGSIRFVEGVPGSAYLGSPVETGVEVAWISPSARVALARRGGMWLALRGLGSETTESVELGAAPEYVRWSSGGRFAAALLPEEQLGVWDAESMQWVLHVEAPREGELAGVAVTDEGILLAGWFDGESTRLARWQDGAWQDLGGVRGRGVIAQAGEMTVLAGAGEIAAFIGADEAWRTSTKREDGPVGVAIRRGAIAAAFGGDHAELVCWNTDGGEAQRLALELAPNRLEPLAGGDGFLLRQREREGDEIWVAVRRGATWTVYFVPAGE
jgi:hypothetical protein